MSKTNTSKRRREKEFNPALRIRDFYSFSLQILNEINYAREHPDEFVEKLKELQETVEDSKDNCLYIENVPFVYNNLLGSLDDSIIFLEKQKELPKLIYNKTITQACDYLLDELLTHDGLDDENANNYSLENRLNKFGRPMGENYELIDYGMFDPEFIVINFVLGDGDKNKFERNVIFNPKVKYIGIASGILSSDKICTIINCCEEFYDSYDKIPSSVEQKYNKKAPSFNTKTINNYSGKSGNSTNIERYTSNTKKEGNVEEQFTEEINTKKGDSGDVYSVKKTEYIKRKESVKDSNKDKNKDKNNEKKDARIPLRNKKTKNEPKNIFDVFDDDEDFDEEAFFDKEFDIHFGEKYGDKKNNKKSSKKTTTTTTTTDDNGVKKTIVTTITEEIDGRTGGRKRQYFDEGVNNKEDNTIPKVNQKSRKSKVKEREERERKLREEREKEEREKEENEAMEEIEEMEKREKERKERQRQKELEKQREYEKELELKKEKEKEKEKEKQDNMKYKKKIIEIPIKLKPKKEENSQFDDGTYKTVQEIPSHKKGYYEKEFEREEEEIENDYPTDYRVKKNNKYKISEDLYEKEEDFELPEGASTMQVKQKTIMDSKGVPALIIKKTITYEDGSVKTIIEKKPINKK